MKRKLTLANLPLIFVAVTCATLLGAQSPMLPGFPPGTFQNRAALDSALVTYQGPGDAFSGATAVGSCARAYTTAFAATAAAICDIVDTATGATSCTLKINTNGFADLTAVVCPTSAPTVGVTTWCTVTNVAGCSITKAYDQTGNGNHFTQATLASMPLLTLGAINSLPSITFAGGAAFLATGTKTQAQPFTLVGVYNRTSGNSAGGVIGSDAGTTICVGATSVAATAQITAGTSQTATAADAAYHAISGLFNGASSAINVDGSDTAGVNAGANAFSGNAIRIGRCSGATIVGRIMEALFYPVTSSPTNRGDYSTNAHGANGYNF